MGEFSNTKKTLVLELLGVLKKLIEDIGKNQSKMQKYSELKLWQGTQFEIITQMHSG